MALTFANISTGATSVELVQFSSATAETFFPVAGASVAGQGAHQGYTVVQARPINTAFDGPVQAGSTATVLVGGPGPSTAMAVEVCASGSGAVLAVHEIVAGVASLVRSWPLPGGERVAFKLSTNASTQSYTVAVTAGQAGLSRVTVRTQGK